MICARLGRIIGVPIVRQCQVRGGADYSEGGECDWKLSHTAKMSLCYRTRGNAKNECLKNSLISFIQRTVDERAGAGGRWHSDLAVFNNLVNLFPRSGSDSFPVALRIRPSKPCDFLDGLSDRSLGDSPVWMHVWDWTIFSRRHTAICRATGACH